MKEQVSTAFKSYFLLPENKKADRLCIFFNTQWKGAEVSQYPLFFEECFIIQVRISKRGKRM